MRKIANIKTALICFILLLGITQAEARDIYVSPTGAASGDGATVGAPVNLTRLWAIINGDTFSDNTVNVYFAGGTYTVTTSLGTSGTNYFNRTQFNGKTVIFLGTGTPTNPTIFDGDGSNNQLLHLVLARSSANTFSFTMSNIIMQNFSDNSATNMFNITGAYNRATLDAVTIRSCHNSTAGGRLFLLNQANAELNVSNSSIIGNIRGSTTNLMYLQAGTSRIYNNTFSGNACQYSIVIATAASGTRYVFNNTLYNTGTIEVTSSGSGGSFKFLNNIVSDSPIIITGTVTLTATDFARNILGSSYYAVGNSGGVALPTFSLDFNTTLTPDAAPGKQVHQLQNLSNASHSIVEKGGTIASLNTETGVSLTQDQTGLSRPSPGNIALGSVEKNPLYITVKDKNLYFLENQILNIPRPASMTVDLPALVVEAAPGLGALTYELLSPTSLSIGALSSLTAENKTTFTPANGVFTGTGAFTFNVKSGNTVVATGRITVTLAHLSVPPPGYTNPGEFNTCFAYMGAVDFTSAYRYRSQNVSGNGTASHDRMYGFSIPLVGDLDGDGYPEIIGIGTNGGNTNGSYNSIHIYDGRSGKRMARLYLPGCSSSSGAYTHGNYHGSPSIMALVNSDPNDNDIVEVIVAFPNSGGDSNYRGKLASYNLVPTVVNGVTTTYTMNLRWGPIQYNLGGSNGTTAQSNYEKPVPTVVDIDGDGIPEVLAYNKIYNARTGALLTTLESLNHTAHVGADDGAYLADDYIGFNYVYDMDLDGTYDVVAGGKVYQLAKNGTSFSYTTIDANSISGVSVPDGRTGVADINGDGIPDVVNVTRAGLSNSITSIRVVVWSPGFFQMTAYTPTGTPVLNSSGELIRLATPHPYILADVTFNLYRDGGSGSNSYVFIGDIDGREQLVDGKTYRLPEIAILAREYTYGSLTRHPNIADIPTANGGISSATSGTTGGTGVIAGLTWDANSAVTAANQKLKLSFILEHADRSNNTGFTMFDFDNDGKQEICYRDEQTLRIIKASRPYVAVDYTASDVVLFRETVNSYTGFEYPVIADIDNDASAEMVVMGHEDGAGDAWGYIYAVGNGSGGKFAPALPVWNQFMYDPFKINPDLSTPTGPAVNRLSSSYTFRREIKDENNQVISTISEYQPFNGTLLQAPHYIGIESEPGKYPNFEPIVFLTEAYIVDNDDPVVAKRPLLEESGSPLNTYIYINIGNHVAAKTDISPNTPISIYKNNKVSKENFVGKYTLATLAHEGTPGTYSTFGANTISPGQEFRFRIQLPTGSNNIGDIYIVRLGDNSDTTPTTPIWRWGLNEDPDGTLGDPDLGTGQASRQFRDCYWPDQSVRVSLYQAINDAQTVQEFRSVEINIWDNDILPDAFFVNLHIPAADSMLITIPPKAGYLSYSGTGRDSRIEYHHDARATLTNAVDSFHYKIRFWDSVRNQLRTDSAAVYIYVMESATGGFAACYGATTTIRLANKPLNGVAFNWFDETGEHHIGSGLSRTLQGFIEGDSIYQVQPRITLTPNPYNVEFPKGRLTISLATTSPNTTATMRWTGLVDHNWRNPGNWVEIKGSYEAPVNWVPTGCVDVIIPSAAVNYPELIDTAVCRNITMKDRAMLTNPHVLKYNNAQVEFKLTPTEKDRFVMWSAPLQSMYSGDYHFKNNAAAPQWGDVFVNYFQTANPDLVGSVATAAYFTATVGNPGVALPLGKAFNLRLASTSANRDSILVFPKTSSSYSANNQTYPTARTNGSRFLTEQLSFSGNSYDLPVNGGSGFRVIEVVNPYMAYLDVAQFIAGQSNNILANGYLLWDGDVNKSPIGHHVSTTDGMRYFIVNAETLTGTNVGLIAPLKSFFVIKSNASANLTSLKISPQWTTTVGTNPYTLRASTQETNILRVKASQGEKASHAALFYDAKAFPTYNAKEDVYQMFYEEIPLTVFSLTPQKEALSINTSGDFSSTQTDLGLRVRDPGEVTLSFSGLPSFGHEVYLIDKELQKEIDLQKNPSYTFVVVKAADSKAIELNSRFSLRARYTGVFTGNEAVAEQPGWNVSGAYGRIDIQSFAGLISRLHIYSVTGALVYSANTASERFSIPVAEGIYIIKAQIGDEYKVEKVFVR
ncbi:MAG: VCBS repeat-containing protein [Tannerellaceae bacterium]|jgi:hypothetical protein|nr:VCBS repeat-containing protein [Tannerellaceae bacterium]